MYPKVRYKNSNSEFKLKSINDAQAFGGNIFQQTSIPTSRPTLINFQNYKNLLNHQGYIFD